MAFSYIKADRDQLFLMPADMREWLPEGHLAWFVLDVVARLDTRALHVAHPNDGSGRAAYDPDVMLALLIYAYCTGRVRRAGSNRPAIPMSPTGSYVPTRPLTTAPLPGSVKPMTALPRNCSSKPWPCALRPAWPK